MKAIADLHGGTVHATSAGVGRGSEFVVRVPLAAAREAVQGGRTSRQGRRRQRVLVVDDNPDAAESLAEIASMLGHVVEIAYDGPSAVEKARSFTPSIVLCDIGLPGMSGYEVAQALRAGAIDGLQIVAVSGYAQPEDVKRALAAGFDAHVAKPCDAEKIARLLA